MQPPLAGLWFVLILRRQELLDELDKLFILTEQQLFFALYYHKGFKYLLPTLLY